MRWALMLSLLLVACTKPSADALLAQIEAAHEDYDLDTFDAASRAFMDRFEDHPAYDGVRYRLAEQMVANTLLKPQSEEAVEARRMLARAAKDAKTPAARFDAALLLLKFRPDSDPIAEAEAMLRRFEGHPGLEQVYFWVVAKLEGEGRHEEAAQYAKRLLERYPDVESADTYRAVVRRDALVGNPPPFGDALDAAQRARLDGKVVLVDFWATWCAPCVAAMPRIVQFHRDRSSDGFELVQVSLDEDDDAYARFREEHTLPGIQLRSTGDAGVDERFGVEVLPSYVVVSRDGKVTNTQSSDTEVFTLLKRMLGPTHEDPR
ncbi:MAG: TlpA disulfide reductase family protein [Deltaproteobacteria bacterium]